MRPRFQLKTSLSLPLRQANFVAREQSRATLPSPASDKRRKRGKERACRFLSLPDATADGSLRTLARLRFASTKVSLGIKLASLEKPGLRCGVQARSFGLPPKEAGKARAYLGLRGGAGRGNFGGTARIGARRPFRRRGLERMQAGGEDFGEQVHEFLRAAAVRIFFRVVLGDV